MKFRKKPVEVEAYCYDQKTPRPDWFQDAVTENIIITYPNDCYINTLEGKMWCKLGDWVIKGIKGEIYSCKPDIFEMTYELVAEGK